MMSEQLTMIDKDYLLDINGKRVFRYKACGLDNIYLVEGYNLNDGGYSITAIDELHACIAITLVTKKQNLTGKEFRFIRKELKMSQKDLAEFANTDVQAVARWEKGEVENGSVNLAERMIRMLYLARHNRVEEVEPLFKHLAELDAQCQKDWIFEEKESGWVFKESKKVA